MFKQGETCPMRIGMSLYIKQAFIQQKTNFDRAIEHMYKHTHIHSL